MRLFLKILYRSMLIAGEMIHFYALINYAYLFGIILKVLSFEKNQKFFFFFE